MATTSGLPCLVLAGPSGVGKGTLIKLLQDRHPGVFGFSVSHATRQPRAGEVDGVHYNFVTVAQFEELIAQGGFFLEYAKVHGNYYGSSFGSIEKVASKGQLCVLDIDCQGARSARKAGIKGTYVFISPPSLEELERRLRTRGTETEESIQRRMQTTQFEMAASDETYKHKPLFDEIICNDVLEDTVVEIEQLVQPYINAVRALKEGKGANAAAAAGEAAQAASTTGGGGGGGGAKASAAPTVAAGEAAGEATPAAAPSVVTEELSVGWMVRTAGSLRHPGVQRRLLAGATLLLFYALASKRR
jgi:guanylate kinase